MPGLHYANELLVRVRQPRSQGLFSSQGKGPGNEVARQTFLNLEKQYEKNVWEKSNDAYSLSIRVQTTINHITICFYHNINVKENVFFFFQSLS